MASQVKRREGIDARHLADVLGARVRARRGDLGKLSQVDLANRVNGFGHTWTHGTVSRIESGQSEPSLSELVALMFSLESSFEELTDPVIAGGDPVDIGFNEPQPAEYVRDLLSGLPGTPRVRHTGTRRREEASDV